MEPYKIVSIVLIGAGILGLIWYFKRQKKYKDEDYIDRLR